MRIAVLGAGGWGTALAVLWHRHGRDVLLWTPFEQERRAIREAGEHSRVLPGIRVPETLPITTDIEEAVGGAQVVLLVTPSQFIEETACKAAPFLAEGTPVISAAKGLERTENPVPRTLTALIEEALRTHGVLCPVLALSGPSHAEEVGRGLPTTIVLAGENPEPLQKVFSTPTFRVYRSTDRLGVELGGALKNPIAIAAGIGAGLGGGDNALGALVTRGMVEIARLGTRAGARPETFWGLSGIGDLVTTCASPHSRNRRVGMELAKGRALDDILRELGMVAEGVQTAQTVDCWARHLGIETPITSAVARVLFQGSSPMEELQNLMTRDLKEEHF